MSGETSISFIGGGNMAGAIINALISSQSISANRISVYEPSKEKCDDFRSMGITICESNINIASNTGILVLAVKPQVIDSVLNEIKGKIKSRCVVSIAAGISVGHIKSIIGSDVPVVRVLPNTPMLVLEGMTVVADAPDVDPEVFKMVTSVFRLAGEVVVLPESKINEAIPLSSSSPAFFFRMLDAMAKAGESFGLSYDDSLKLSATAMYGSAKYLISSDKTADELVRQVSSPGGTTIAALSAFDDFSFEELINEASKRCVERAYELSSSK